MRMPTATINGSGQKVRVKAVLRQSVAGCAASLCVLTSATVFAWVTPTLHGLLGPDSEIPMSTEEAAWMVAIPDVGTFFSPLPAGFIADRIGRKIVILSTAPMFLVGWGIILYFKTLLALNVARIIQGLAIGIAYTIVPMYLGEIADPKHRGFVTNMFNCLWWFGFVLEYLIGPYMSFDNFTYVTASINVVFLLAFIWQPETPYYYLMKNDTENARNSLSWLFCTNEEETSVELLRMKQGEDSKRKVPWNELVANRTNRKALAILFANGTIRIFCGIFPLSTYSTETLLASGDVMFTSPENVTRIMGFMMFFGTIFSSFTLDIFGRRPMFFFSCLMSGILTFLAGTYYFLTSHTNIDTSSFTWIPPIALIIFSAVSVMGIFPVSIAYQSELFDSNTRAVASSVLIAYTTLAGVAIYKYYLTILFTFGAFVDFYIFSFSCFVGVLLSFSLLPETKGKTFEQIRLELSGTGT